MGTIAQIINGRIRHVSSYCQYSTVQNMHMMLVVIFVHCFISSANGQANVRLVGSGLNYEGRLEVYYGGVWGTVCDDSFADVDARVACSMLGFGFVGRTMDNFYGPGSGQIWLDEVQCFGSETTLASCGHNQWGIHNCAHSEDVSISCGPSGSPSSTTTTTPRTTTRTSTPTSTSTTTTRTTTRTSTPSTTTTTTPTTTTRTGTMYRLSGGPSAIAGRLEVNHNGSWGTVCDDGFDNTDARVACFSLGFGYVGEFVYNKYGPGTGKIWLDEVVCNGQETSIGSCVHNVWGNHDCKHSEDVSVSCIAATCKNCRPTGQCIARSMLCDGIQDCPDDSDEANCTCKSDVQFACSNGRCIHRDWLCDGKRDCPQGDDELLPSCARCQRGTQFQCESGTKCLNASQECDGVAQCTDLSDEGRCVNLSSTLAMTVKYRGQPGYYVCSNRWTVAFSDVVCQRVGFISALSTSNVSVSSSSYLEVKSGGSPSPSNISNLLSALQTSTCPSQRAVKIACSMQGCGKRAVNVTEVGPYILNGHWAARGAWPWQAMIKYNGYFHCGGSLINNKWLLTAAHCTRDHSNIQIPENQLKVRLGAIQFSDPEPGVIYSNVAGVYAHKEYNNKTHNNDVALLRLNTSLNYTDTIRPICLPPSDVDLNQFKVCVSTGFGQTFPNGTHASRLLQVRMSILPYETCDAWHPHQYINATMICLGGETTADGNTCYGDSGGPLACKNQEETWTVIGITSFGYDCTQHAGTRVSAFVPWMQKIMADNP